MSSTNQTGESRAKGPSGPGWIRRGLVVAATIILLIWLGIQLAAQYFLNDENLGAKIAQAIHDNTGFNVDIDGGVRVLLWPLPKVRLEEVTILPPGDSNVPVLTADVITGTVDLLSTLLGDPVLARVSLDGAALHYESTSDGHSNLEPVRPSAFEDSGIANDDAATAEEPAAAEQESAPATETPPALSSRFPVREIVFANSSVEIVKDGAVTLSLANAGGRVNWPGLDAALSFRVTADYRDKTMTVAGEAPRAVELIEGRSSQLSFSARSSFLNANFEGSGNFSSEAFLDGDFSIQSESLPELLEWLGDPMRSSIPISTIDVSSRLTTSGTNLTLESLELTVDDVPARGALEVGLPPGGIPSLKGTLAFDTFDIYGFLTTFTPIPMGPGGTDQRINTGFLRRLQLDLRLSATTATYGAITLDGMAASARIDNRFASFDIAAARFADASVTARLTLDERNLPKRTAGLRLDTGRINLATLATALGLAGPLPDARGNISAELTADLPFWAAAPADISGMVQVTSGAGTLRNFNTSAFRRAAAEGGFFNLSDVSDGSMPYRKLNLNTRVENGMVEILDAELSGPDNTLALKGIIPYRNQSLALTGTLSSTADSNNNVYFFAGGAWPDIVITPVSALIRQPAQMQDGD